MAAFRSPGYGIAFSLALFAMPAAAQLIDESFTGNTIAGWALSGQACLTAPGGLLSCSGTAPNYNDPPDEGWLRLTSSTHDQVAHVISEGAVPFGEGVQVSFDYAMYAGDAFTIPGLGPYEGDGISLFLTDASIPGNGDIDLGGEHFGGSLGYCGMVGAVFGVGLDRFGNFSWTQFSDCGDGPAIMPDHVVVRAGSDASPPYHLLASRDAMGELRTDAGWLPPDGARTGRRVTFRVAFDDSCGANPWRIVLHNDTDDIAWVDDCLSALTGPEFAPPADVRVGFAAATGAASQYQEIRLVAVAPAVELPFLVIEKTASAPVFVVGVESSYLITVRNDGLVATTADATITDTIPSTLTLGTMPPGCSAAGQTVTCTIPAGLDIGASVTFEIPVTPTAAASGTMLENTATVSGGGDPTCPDDATHCESTVFVPVDAPELTLVKTVADAAFTVGVASSYTLTVTNTGSAATTADATIDDDVPPTLTLGAMPPGCAAAGQHVTCTIPAGLAPGESAAFVIPVTPTADASGTLVVNTASVTGGGDPSCPADAERCESTVETPVDAPLLSIVKTADATPFVVGVATTYTLTVTNIGTAATTAPATVSDLVPATLALGAMPAGCTASGQQVLCTIAAGLGAGASVSFVIPVTPLAAASGTIVVNAAAVSGGGDPGCPGDAERCESTVETPVDAPLLAIVKIANGPFVVGIEASFTLTVTNIGTAATTAVATITDAVPEGLALGAMPPGCGAARQVVTCTIAAGLTPGASASFVIPVTPSAATDGETLTNTATVGGGGDPTCPEDATRCESEVPVPIDVPVLSILKTASATPWTVGVAASFTLTVTNIGSAATTAAATVSDTVPDGLEIGALPSGCTATGQLIRCTIPAGLLPSAQAAFVIPVTPAASVAGTTLVNLAIVTGGGDPTCPADASRCESEVPVPIDPVADLPADLAIVKTVDQPTPGVGDVITFTLVATNFGPADATGVVVADALPSGYALVSAIPGVGTYAGTEWIIGDLANGASATLTINATVNASGDYLNTATVRGQQPDPVPENNTDDAVTSPVGPPPQPGLARVPLDARWALAMLGTLLLLAARRRLRR